VEITRVMTIPIFDGPRIVALVAVGNKDTDYDESDLRHLTLLMQNTWRLIHRNQTAQERLRFINQLSTAAHLSGQINAILDPDPLLHEIVGQLCERFDLYYAHIYLLDEEQCKLVLRAGVSQAGPTLFGTGYSIPLEREASLVACAVRERDVVLVNDVSKAEIVPNPLLPNTLSQVAVPLVVGDEVLGALDLQDHRANRFTPSELDVFRSLAGHIAIALQNAAFVKEIRAKAEHLRQVDRVKGEFLSSMSHEMRTPLSSIIGFAEVLLMGISGDLSVEAQGDVQAIFDNGQHLLRVVNDVLDLAKIEAGTLDLFPESVQVASLLEEIRDNNAGLLVNKSIELLVEAEPDLPTLQADPVRIKQVLNNLVSNAVKFTDQGAVILRACRENGWVSIAVQDSGVGIGAEDLGKLFERFQQVGSSEKRVKGTGLGLAITRELVEMHGGTIEVQSQLGQGSTFTVRLPVGEGAGSEVA
jgi:signal transduction histidine kinase